ncbi:MAG: translocation/assembly module TamB domain-containing protein [Reichenbachiella sp.]|uniref:translocation/assembly module TamB domain-containing protein n=1 Tax=Reichenbachiella sp. TaxID=2184521 RepID=UPI0032646120
MKEKSRNTLTLRRILSRLFLWFPILFLALGILLFSVFQIPKVQTRVLNEVSFLISENTGFDVKIGHANLTWFDYMVVKNVRLYDHQNDSTLIHIKELQIDLKLYDFIVHRRLNADKLELNQPYLHIIKETDSTEVNISRLLADLKELFRKNRKNKERKTSISLDRVEINDGIFSYNDMRYDSIQTGKDYHHFKYKSIQADLLDFSFIDDSLGMKIDYFTSIDSSDGLNIKSLISKFSFTKKQMIFSNLALETEESFITDSITFSYSHPSNFKYFNDSITFFANLDQSTLSTNELALFNHNLKAVDKKVLFSGKLYGAVNNLKIKEFTLQTGNRTIITGNAQLNGLPKITETFIDLDVKKSIIDPSDHSELLSDKIQKEVLNLGAVEVEGQFLGFLSDFVAEAKVTSSVGKIDTDINFKIDGTKRARYTGNLHLQHFDLRSIFPDQNQLKHITLKGKIKGSGLQIANANFNLNAAVDSVSLNDYTYTKLYTNGSFKVGFFAGKLTAADPNLEFSSTLELDLKEDRNKINIQADLKKANLKQINISNQDIRVASHLDLDLKGLKTDDLIGYVSLYNSQIIYEEKELYIDSVKLLSTLIGENRIIHLDTDGLTAEMNGEFRNSVFIRTVLEFYNEIKLNIRNDEEELEMYYIQKKDAPLEKYHIQMEFSFRDLNRFIEPFYPNISFSKEVNLRGSFLQDSVSRLNLYSVVDSLFVSETVWAKNYIDINVSKEYFDKSTLASAFVSSGSQVWSEKFQTENIYTDLIWFEDSMTVALNIEQPDTDNQVEIETSVLFYPDSTRLHFNRSDIKLLGKTWSWEQDNEIIYKDEEWEFTNVKVSNGLERLELSGSYSEAPGKLAFIDLKEFNLQNADAFINSKLEGTLDGRIKIKRQPENDLIEGNVVARAVKIKDFLVGNIFGVTRWDSYNSNLAVNLDLVQNDKKKIEIKGLYYPKNDFDQFNLQAKFDSADLKIAEPFLQNKFSQLNGFASGQFTIHGNFGYPILKGKGSITDGEVLVNYLNTKYEFNGNLIFEENEISTQRLLLRDNEQNIAHFSGGIFHDGFKNAVIDFQGEFENFKLLNTTAADNSGYYGVAFGTGTINLLGALSNIKISAEAQTAKGTRLSIPIDESSDSRIEQKEYIEFIDLKNHATIEGVFEEVHQREKLKIRGIELDFDIEITNDAYVELIFDVQSGDIIRGRGNGNIELQINTDGDFTMFGDFVIEQGGYNFTMYNIINKEFEIKNGSTISWYGDPYGANLNISASYRQLASLAPLMVRFLDPDDLNSAETRKKYPSIVDLKLSGNLLTPEIKFGISIEDYPQNNRLPNSAVTLDEVVTAFKASIGNNEQEMNRQVFSLIVLRKFSEENSFQINGQTIGNSLSEFVSNQLSYWATQVDDNLEVDVDLAGLSEDAFNTFQLRLSYTFLDGRLRVTRGSSLANQETQRDVSNIIGDWTVEYLLTEDGRFRVKMYSRSDLNTIDQQLGESNFETGFSLQYIKSFDQLSQILSDNRKKNISQKKTSKEDKEKKEQI